MLGGWTQDIQWYKNGMGTNSYIKIDSFLNASTAENAHNEFPLDTSLYHKYHNPIEVKYALNNLSTIPNSTTIQNIFTELSSDYTVSLFREISGIQDLEVDPLLHGAGLHLHPRHGRLNLHLDYEKHPILENKQRRLNIILYLNKEWDHSWNGATELWNSDCSECTYKSNIEFNKAIVFKTSEQSWHGVPERILCPEGTYRQTLAYYYISPLQSETDTSKAGSNSSGYREKAVFVQHPYCEYNPNLQKLLDIRPYRRLTVDDVMTHIPNWNYKTDNQFFRHKI